MYDNYTTYIICPECGKRNKAREAFNSDYRGNSVYICKYCKHEFADFECRFITIKEGSGNNMQLAVKYRPKTFEDVAGQDLIKQVLVNQVDNNELSTGYLFSGGSGIGKTTIARILANNLDAEIIEIDGASNNGVENVREIRKNVNYKSISNDYKVYIIDECHMLSKGAWNALLKTLEEPPEKVIFMLCTTEPEKVPETIQTRVQTFQFNRLSVEEVKERLRYIAKKEEKEVPDEVLTYIAKISQGGMRNAISILDKSLDLQVLNIQNIIDLIGGVEYKYMIDLLNNILKKDPNSVISIIDDLHMKGRNLKLFISEFVEFIVDLTKYAMNSDNKKVFNYINIPSIYKNDLDNIITKLVETGFKLGDLFDDINDLYFSVKYEQDPKVLIEGKLMQITNR
ncbi:MAG: DNA polymerase III subunit gamma/tau [Nanoarchaeota archaeon]